MQVVRHAKGARNSSMSKATFVGLLLTAALGLAIVNRPNLQASTQAHSGSKQMASFA